jgi:aldehyde dehydrogenase (NAD+)
MCAPGRSKIIAEPLGVALIMGAWNYPLVTHIEPLTMAIAAGNCAIMKPSEVCEHTTKVMTQIIEKYLDKRAFRVVEGGGDVAAVITTLNFDVIAFTGSPMKGKLVAAAAGKNLVKCILELGGKCPAIIDDSADIDFAAKKVAFARFTNHGQTCLAVDYVLVHSTQKEKFVELLRKYIT